MLRSRGFRITYVDSRVFVIDVVVEFFIVFIRETKLILNFIFVLSFKEIIYVKI